MTAPARRVELSALAGIPRIEAGDPLLDILCNVAKNASIQENDILAVTSKLFSRAQNRFVHLPTVEISDEAATLARTVDKDPALVTLILQESTAISRAVPGVLIVRHRLGMVCANAAIDRSNAMPKDAPPNTHGEWALLLPNDPDEDARALRQAIHDTCGVSVGIVITDSHGRPFRNGSIGIAIGTAGIAPLDAHENRQDLDGRTLEVTSTAVADQIAAASDLLAGQADEGTPVVLFRGLKLAGERDTEDGNINQRSAEDDSSKDGSTDAEQRGARALCRDPEKDLYA